MMHTLAAVALFLEGTLSGVFVGSAMMEHAARSLDAAAWISYNRAKDTIYGPVMPVFFGVTLVVSIATSAVGDIDAFHLLAAASLFIAGVVTVCIHLPLNKAFAAWSRSEYPANWSEQRGYWRRWNLVRTLCAILAFAFNIAAF